MNLQNALSIAMDAMRLFKGQDPEFLQRVYGTNSGEILEAMSVLDQLKKIKPKEMQPLSLEDQEIKNRFKKQITEKVGRLSDFLTYGKAADWADYKQKVGEIAGLRNAMNTYSDTINDIDMSDDNDD